MYKQYETSELAPDPLPGPTKIPFLFACLTKSLTIKNSLGSLN